MEKNVLLIITYIIFITGCASHRHVDVDGITKKAPFLTNTWESYKDGIVYHESWHRNQDTLQGITIIYTEKDTLFYEKNKIFLQKKQLVFHSSVGKYISQNQSTMLLHHANRWRLCFKNDNQGISYRFKRGKLHVETWIKDENGITREKFVLSKKST